MSLKVIEYWLCGSFKRELKLILSHVGYFSFGVNKKEMLVYVYERKRK